MSEYTKNLTAEQIIAYIATDYVELSHDKHKLLRICREWLDHNKFEVAGVPDPCPNCAPNTVCRTITCGRLLVRKKHD